MRELIDCEMVLHTSARPRHRLFYPLAESSAFCLKKRTGRVLTRIQVPIFCRGLCQHSGCYPCGVLLVMGGLGEDGRGEMGHTENCDCACERGMGCKLLQGRETGLGRVT